MLAIENTHLIFILKTVPPLLPSSGFPDGQIVYYLACNCWLIAEVRTPKGSQFFYVEEIDGFWRPCEKAQPKQEPPF